MPKSAPVLHKGLVCTTCTRDEKSDYQAFHAWKVVFSTPEGKELKGGNNTKSATEPRFVKGGTYDVDIVTLTSDTNKTWSALKFAPHQEGGFSSGGGGKKGGWKKKSPEEQKSINYALARECAITFYTHADQNLVTRDAVNSTTKEAFKWLVAHGLDESSGPRASGCIRRAASMMPITCMSINSIEKLIAEADEEWRMSDPNNFK